MAGSSASIPGADRLASAALTFVSAIVLLHHGKGLTKNW